MAPTFAWDSMRIGFGYDVHPLVQGRKLVLGGVELADERGLAGHSDADVLVHAIIDALLGAAALGDIGAHFPPSDPAYKDVSSIALLQRVAELLRDGGWRVGNIDVTVVAQRPQLAPFIGDMRQRISEALGIDRGKVSVKATTSEGLGFAGREEGIAAYAVAALDGGDEDA